MALLQTPNVASQLWQVDDVRLLPEPVRETIVDVLGMRHGRTVPLSSRFIATRPFFAGTAA
jgi:hypothetical protein